MQNKILMSVNFSITVVTIGYLIFYDVDHVKQTKELLAAMGIKPLVHWNHQEF